MKQKVCLTLKDKLQEAHVRRLNAHNYYLQGKFKESLEQILITLKIYKENKVALNEQLEAYTTLSYIYNVTKDPKKSLETALSVLNLIKNQPIEARFAKYYFNVEQYLCYFKRI